MREKLKKKGIEIRASINTHYISKKFFTKIKNNGSQNYKKLYLKNSEALSGKIFGLPNHYKLKKRFRLYY